MALTQVSRGLLSTSIVDNGNATAITIDSSEQVGIGVTPFSAGGNGGNLMIGDPTSDVGAGLTISATSTGDIQFGDANTGAGRYAGLLRYDHTTDSMAFWTASNEAMRIDSSGNLLVGKTSASGSTAGAELRATGSVLAVRDGDFAGYFNRKTSDGEIVRFVKDTTTVGSILSSGGDGIIVQGVAAGSGLLFHNSDALLPAQNGNAVDATIDLGRSTPSAFRFKDLYLSGTANVGSQVKFNAHSGYDERTIGLDSTGLYVYNATDSRYDLSIDSSGRLLVNTSSILTGSGAKLQVLQTVGGQWSQRTNNSTSSPYGMAIDYVSANPNGTANQFIYCTTTAGARFAVYSNGGVGNYSGNNVNLSDRNAKKDITLHTDDEWNCVKAWEIVDYRYNDEADDSPAKIGVIAQQIQEHCPDLVNVFQEQADAVEEVLGEDGEVVTEAKAAVEERIGVNEAQMMWKVTKAFQEAMERIETLEAKVQQLENN